MTKIQQDLIDRIPSWSRLEGKDLERLQQMLPIAMAGSMQAAAVAIGVSDTTLHKLWDKTLRSIGDARDRVEFIRKDLDECRARNGHHLDCWMDLPMGAWRIIKEASPTHEPKTWEELYYLWPRLRASPDKTKLAKQIAAHLGDDWNPKK